MFLKKQEFGRYIKIKSLQENKITNNFEIRLLHPWKKKKKKQMKANTNKKNDDYDHGKPITTIQEEQQESILLHSNKRRKGDHLLQTKKEREAIVSRIDAILMEPWPDEQQK